MCYVYVCVYWHVWAEPGPDYQWRFSISHTHIRGTSAHNLSGLANLGSGIHTHADAHTPTLWAVTMAPMMWQPLQQPTKCFLLLIFPCVASGGALHLVDEEQTCRMHLVCFLVWRLEINNHHSFFFFFFYFSTAVRAKKHSITGPGQTRCYVHSGLASTKCWEWDGCMTCF